MDILLDDLKEEYPSKVGAEKIPRIACIGGRWEIDSVACEMLVHALSLEGIAATERREGVTTARYMGKLDLDNIDIVCLSYFSREPETSIRAFCRRLNSRWPGKRILLALWNAPPSLLEPEALKALGADGVVTSIHEAVLRIERMIGDGRSQPTRLAAAPENDDARIEALNATHILDGRKREDLDALARRAAEVFDVAFAVVSVIDAHEEHIIGQSRDLPGPLNGTDMPPLPRAEAIGGHVVGEGETLVVSDTERDPRFSDNPAIRRWDTRFYAGTPLKTAKGLILGALCLFDKEPRKLDGDDLDLLRSLAADIVSLITETDTPEPEPHPEAPPSTTVAQPVPE
jgi:hypothetical protein